MIACDKCAIKYNYTVIYNCTQQIKYAVDREPMKRANE